MVGSRSLYPQGLAKYLITVSLLYFQAICVSEAGKCEKLTAASVPWPPIYYIANQNKPDSGLGVDLLKAISAKLEIPFEVEPNLSFARQLHQLEEGTLDVVLALYPTNKRLEIYDFSLPYYQEPLHIFSRAEDKLDIKSLADLNGLTGVTIRKASYGEIIDKYLSTKGRTFQVDKNEQRATMLLGHRADYFVNSPLSAEALKTYRDNREKIVMSRSAIYWADVSIAFSRSSACRHLIPSVNKIILEWLSSRQNSLKTAK